MPKDEKQPAWRRITIVAAYPFASGVDKWITDNLRRVGIPVAFAHSKPADPGEERQGPDA